MTETVPSDAPAPQAAVVVERTYRASVQHLWATKSGFESWWGPEGFRVEVHALEPRPGGALAYDMIADSAEMVAAMRSMGQPVSQAVRGSFAEFHPHERLTLVHLIDFVPGSDPYESLIEVDFSATDDQARMIVTIHPHLTAHWTKMSVQGFASQITKLDRRFGWTAD